MNARFIIFECPEGCGYNTYTNNGQNETWIRASRYPMNAATVAKRKAIFLKENPDGVVIETGGYGSQDPSIPDNCWIDGQSKIV